MIPTAHPLLRAAGALLSAVIVLTVPGPAAGADAALTLSRGSGNAETLELTLEELAALPQVTIETENEFSDGMVAYSGPLVRDVLELLALNQSDTVRITAANDYFVEVPTDDFSRFEVILAMEADGKKLSRRDKGPLWLMYPISDNADLRDPIYIHRLIWQVVRIESQ